MRPELQPGLRHAQQVRVEASMTVPALSGIFRRSDDMPPVLATAYMIAFIEWTCLDAVRPLLDPREKTLGTHVDVSHLAATPVGLTVTAQVELVAVEGRKLRFQVSCHDGVDLIGAGVHERTVIDGERFLGRLEEKGRRAGAGGGG
jgi:fluoroacetyl-CoA thioesterase